MMRRLLALLLLSPCAVAPAARAQQPPLPEAGTATPAAEQRPLFELGIAGGGGYTPDYPAADQSRLRGIVSPFLTYRGELFRSDEQGARLRALRANGFEFSLSASGAFPASSRDNRAREGMPDLDWIGEVGPTLRMTLWRDPAAPRRLVAETPLRAVFSTDLSSISFRGWVFNPDIAWEQRNLVIPGSRLRIGLGVVFATERFMDYFYEVTPEFARSGRPAYDARAGYLGARLQFSYRIPITDRLTMIAGGRVENFGGAANADSPLFRRETNFSVAAGFSWTLYRSEATVASGYDSLDN